MPWEVDGKSVEHRAYHTADGVRSHSSCSEEHVSVRREVIFMGSQCLEVHRPLCQEGWRTSVVGWM